ncbi:MFS transporter [Vibrio campbellii]|uniref:MFS transporter n=1 Tax=Vibrio campbellii TaxID=680 RepID=UPI0005765964|nr:MFS transporter [Vibrio campbellii]ARV71340.1 MFS transporter [Vibrio campbellii CAIM 519 = NBRC 15631 = ATCC 25920]
MESVSKSESIWVNKTFYYAFFSTAFVVLGTKIYDIALPLLVFDLTGSSEFMGLIRAVEFLPGLLFAAFIGVLVDNRNPKSWSNLMLLGQLVTILLSYIFVRFSNDAVYYLIPCAFLMSAFSYGYNIGRGRMMKVAISSKLQNRATSSFSFLYNFMDSIGPIISGAVLFYSSAYDIFPLVSLLFFIALIQNRKIRIEEIKTKKNNGVFSDLKIGWWAFKKDKCMVDITLAVMFINVTGAIFWIQSIYFGKSTLGFDALEVSYLFAGAGIGGIIGSFSAEIVRKRIGLGRLLIMSIFLESFGFILPVLYPSALSLALSFFWVSAVGLYSNICIWTYRQEKFEHDVIGKVSGITGSLFKLLMPIGLGLSGFFVADFGISTVFVSCFSVQVLVSILLVFSQVKHIK